MSENIILPKEVELVCSKINSAGFEVAIVGGASRSLIQGQTPTDWDLTTSATPDQILAIFENSFYNNQYGTVGVLHEDVVVEVTTYRTESNYTDSRHPENVQWGKSLEEDLSRRDFTINAIAIPYIDNKLKNPVDPFGGLVDLQKKIIKTVGDPDERFKEDALRLLRAIRFATTLDFEIDQDTLTAIRKNAGSISKISGERIREELFKIVESQNAQTGIMQARETALLKEILPELDDCFDIPQISPKRHHIYDVGTHCVKALQFCPSKDTITRFATLLHDIGKAKVAKTINGVKTFYNHEVVGGRQVNNISQRLNLSRQQREKLFRLVRWHQFSVNENQTDSAIRRFIKNVGLENVNDMIDLRVGDRLGGGLQQPESWRLKLFKQRIKEVLKKPFTVTDLKINGNDVMEVLDLKPGRQIGEILYQLFESVVSDKSKNDRQYLLDKLKEFKNER